ncbi:MAG TPA: L,D-transpeptidase family protein [Pyrinomonadaceae bacterium]|nr:L,D-transpeptidase family protein [Pyrinomonadaceae bacterium]
MKIKNYILFGVLSLASFVGACVPPENSNATNSNTNQSNTNAAANSANGNSETSSTRDAAPIGDDKNPSSEEIERGRLNQDWKNFVQADAPTEKSDKPNTEKWADVTAENVNGKQQYLPLSGDVAGPSVLRAQLLLDRARFSPGIIDGKWGKNTEKAVYWLQKREGLTASGQVDRKTYQKLIELAERPDELITEHKLSEKDVSGPFVEIPADIYEKAKMDCMCYESLEEKLSEMYHISPALLQQLNPNVKLNELKAGDTLKAPNLRATEKDNVGDVAKVVISDGGHFVHALDAQDRILAHYPSTLGSDYNPSPSGEYKINSVTEDPWWYYQPELLDEGSGENARIPPGPNNAVGVVWMDLSKPHYGIHGTSAPETIGYTVSHGCVRLTNWDATELGRNVGKGTPVSFRDISNRSDKKEDAE